MFDSSLFPRGAGIAQNYYQRRIRSSETFIVPFDGFLDILAIAGHGSGSVCGWANSSANYPKFAANGASAGECGAKFNIAVKKGDAFIITIGAGGAAASVASMTSAGNSASGNDGSDTTVTCAARGISITVKGGKGSIVVQSASTVVPASVSANPGGTGGSGCDLLAQGGPGGPAVVSLSTAAAAQHCFIIGGPGAVNLFFLDPSKCSGGSATGAGSLSARVFGGPGAPGGKGGDASATGQSTSNTCHAGGGAAGGDGVNTTNVNGISTTTASNSGPNYFGNYGASPLGGLPHTNFGLDFYAGALVSNGEDVNKYSGGSLMTQGVYTTLPLFSCALTHSATTAFTVPPGNCAPGANIYAGITGSTSVAGPFVSGKGGDGLVVLNIRSA